MFRSDRSMAPPGREPSRCFLFLLFFHLLPVPWSLAVAAGLAPASFLLMLGMAGLFNTDSESLAFAAMFLAPTIVAGLIFVMLAIVITAVISKVRKPLGRTLALLAVAVSCVGIALRPVFVTGSHRGGDQFSLLDFLRILEEFRVPRAISIGYFAGLAILLCFLLVAQHKPEFFRAFPRPAWRHVAIVVLAIFAAALVWTHRVTLILTPMAEFGFASQQYRLAMALRERSGNRVGHDSREWLVRAAEQGHMPAAMELVRNPTSAEDTVRWLTVAAEGGMAEAQYELFRLQLRSGNQHNPALARKWLLAAADSDHPLAQFDLGKLYAEGSEAFDIVKTPGKARELWEEASRQGHGQATNELAWRYNMGQEGFKRDPGKAVKLYEQLAEAFASGSIDLPQNQQMSDGARQQAEQIAALEKQIAQGDSEALFKLGSQLIDISRDNPQTVAEGLLMLEQAAESGRADVQSFLGAVFMFGNSGQAKDFPRGQVWWNLAADNNHVKTMELLAKAYQNGSYGYRVDLLKSKELTARLVEAYREGRYGVEADEQKANYWSRELKHFDRLFEISGGSYQSLERLRPKADSGDAAAQYQLGRQLLVSGTQEDRKRGYELIEQAADAGNAEAQYRLVIYYENHLHIMRDNPDRGVAMLTAAANHNHLPAMGELALAYYKGRYGLPRDYRQAKVWYERLLAVHESGNFLGEIDERFIEFQQRQFGYTERALVAQLKREERISRASPLELQVIAIEDCYRKEYERAVNALDRRDGSKAGKARFRVEIDRLNSHYRTLREQEVAQFKAQAESAENSEFVCPF